MPELVNLTPHPIVLRSTEEDIVIPPSGQIARVFSTPGQDRDMGLPVPVRGAPTYGEVENLPNPEDGKVYIVSGMVLARVYGRADVVAPGTGPQDGAVRDPQGRIVAVTRLVACEGGSNA